MLSLMTAVTPLLLLTSLVAQPTPQAIDALAAKTLATGKAPGFSLAIEYDGKPYYAKGYGVLNTSTNAPATADSRYAIGSISKQFAAVSILRLMEQGKLALDDPLAKYYPTFPNATRITLRMLLNQVSGLHNYPRTAEHAWPRSGEIPVAKLLPIFASDKPDFEPGARFEYSNTNYFALAAIVEKVAGVPYRRFLKDTIFTPLGMAQSGNGFADQAGIATAYGGQQAPQPLSLDLFLGAGSVVSSARDLAIWDEALMDGKLLKPASMLLLWTAGKPAAGGSDYAMGFVVGSVAGRRELWHNGLTPTAGGYNLNAIFPDDHLAIAILSNGADFSPQPEMLVNELVKAFFPVNVGQLAAPVDAAPAEDPKVTALARKIYTQIRAGKVDETLLTPAMAAVFTAAALAQQKPIFDSLGDPTKLTFQTMQQVPGGTVYKYLADFAAAQLHVTIVVDKSGKVAGYSVTL